MSRATRLIAATRRLIDSPDGETSDRALLARFANTRDERAFAELVERHGPLVHATCRRLLNDASTADDVFQATFIILARKAARGGWQASIGPWLHAVAVRLALKARLRRADITLDEATAEDLLAPITDPTAPLVWAEVKEALDLELDKLSPSLSQPLILCYLQGRTRDEAASLLGISLAKLKRRLNRARNLLRDRLSRRGITLSVAGWSIALTSPPLTAELRDRVIRLALNSTQAQTIPPAIADLVAGFPRVSMRRWIIASAMLTVGLSIALASAISTVDPLPDPPPSQPSVKLESDEPTPAPQVKNETPIDPLPAGAVARFGSPRLQDFTISESASFSPDGKLFATSGPNNPLSVWDAATGKLVHRHAYWVSAHDLRWQADGALAAISFSYNAFVMRSFGDRKDPDHNDEHRAIVESPPKDFMRDAFLSGNGKWVFAVCANQQSTSIRIERFPFAAVKPDKSIPVASGNPGIQGAWVSHDGRTVLVYECAKGDRPNRLVAYDLAAEKPEQPVWARAMPAGDEHRPEVCLTSDGKKVVIVAQDDTVEVWDGPAGKRLREFPKMPKSVADGQYREARGIDLTPDGKRLAMTFRGPTYEVGGRVVDVDTGKEVCILAPQPLPLCAGVLRFSADGKRVGLVASGVARIWNAETGADAVPLPGHCGWVTSLVPTLDGKRIVSAGADFTVREWDPQTGKETWRTTLKQTIAVRFATPEGIVVQESGFNTAIPGIAPGALLDAKSGKRRPLPGALGEAKTMPAMPRTRPAADLLLAMAPDGKSIVTLAWCTPAFRVWSWPGGELKATLAIAPPEKHVLGRCTAAHFTPDGKLFIAVMQYNFNKVIGPGSNFRKEPVFVERWDLAKGKMLERANGGTDDSPPKLIPYAEGVLILGDGPEVLDAVTRKSVVTLGQPEKEPLDFRSVKIAALSPDGRVLALGVRGPWTNNVQLFEMRSGKHRQVLVPEVGFNALQLLPDSPLAVPQILVPQGSFNALQFLPDGRLVTAGQTALVWPVELPPAPE